MCCAMALFEALLAGGRPYQQTRLLLISTKPYTRKWMNAMAHLKLKLSD